MQPQHLTCVNACRDISDARVDGNEIGSTMLRFNPQVVRGGSYTFGSSSFTTTKITRHLMTNIWTVKHFIDADIRVTGKEGEEGRVIKC